MLVKRNNVYTVRSAGKMAFVLPKSFSAKECDTFYRSVGAKHQYFNSDGNYVAVVVEITQ